MTESSYSDRTSDVLTRPRCPRHPELVAGRREAQLEQSTATARAAQISRIRASATRPRRWTRIAIETLSIESRLTAERRGTGSSPGSRRTSLGRPRMVVVQGAMSARRWRGITASRDRTTTGLRPIPAMSHHHTSPRAGRSVTTRRPPAGRRPGLPIRPARRVGARRTGIAGVDLGRAVPRQQGSECFVDQRRAGLPDALRALSRRPSAFSRTSPHRLPARRWPDAPRWSAGSATPSSRRDCACAAAARPRCAASPRRAAVGVRGARRCAAPRR